MRDIQRKQKELTDYILKKIYTGALREDDKIPPLRALMEQFDLRYTSAKRAISELVDKGLLDSKMGSGTFVKKHHKETTNSNNGEKKLHITVFIGVQEVGKVSAIQSTVFLGLQEAAMTNNCAIELNYVDKQQASGENTFSECLSTDAIVLLGEYDTVYQEFDVFLPMVSVGMYKNYNGLVSNIDLDPFGAAEIASNYFLRHNKKHVYFVSNQSPIFQMRGRCFALEWQSHGELTILDTTTDFDIDPDGAYLFASGSMLEQCSTRCLGKHGKILHDYTTCLGIDGKHLINSDYHETSAISTDWKLLGRYVLEEAIYRIANPGVPSRRTFLPCQYVEAREKIEEKDAKPQSKQMASNTI